MFIHCLRASFVGFGFAMLASISLTCEASPGWRDIGGEAAGCHEFGAAVEVLHSFMRQTPIPRP